MIAITEDQFWLLVTLGAGSLLLVIGMFIYVIRVARSAYLGDRWIEAAGSYEDAALELENYQLSMNMMFRRGLQHGLHPPPGNVTPIGGRRKRK